MSSRVITNKDLFYEKIELQRMQQHIGEFGFRRLLLLLTEKFGISKRMRSNGLSNWLDFKVYESSSGKIGIRAGYAFTSNGELLLNPVDYPDIFTVTNDNTFRELYISYQETQVEDGTLQLLTDGQIVGTSTKFTETLEPGKKIELFNTVNSNNGSYVVLSVADNTHCLVDAIFTAESNIKGYKVKGRFTPGTVQSNEYIFAYDYFLAEVQPDASALETDNKFLIGRVKNNSGTLTIQDKRTKIWKIGGSNINEPTGFEDAILDTVITKGVNYYYDDSLKSFVTDLTPDVLGLKAGKGYGKTERVKVIADIANILSPVNYLENIAATTMSDVPDGDYYMYVRFKARESNENISVYLQSTSLDTFLNDDNYILSSSFTLTGGQITNLVDRRSEFYPYIYSRRPLPVKIPLNPRFSSISALRNDVEDVPDTIKNKITKFAIANPYNSLARVVIKWGYDGLTGAGDTGADTFVINNAATAGMSGVGLNDLVDYAFYIPATQKSYLIVSNTAQSGENITLQLAESSNRGVPVMTGVTATSGNAAEIHSFADRYNWELIPVAEDNGGTKTFKKDKSLEGRKEIARSPVPQLVVQDLKLGMRYKFRVQAFLKDVTSTVAETPAGTNGTRIEFATITDDGVLALSADDYGFVASVSGWADATHIELVYTTDGTEPDFNNATHFKIPPTSSRKIPVPMTASTKVKVGVRGLINGYQVTLVKTAEIVSGGGGIAPLGEKLIDQKFELISYTGKVKSVSQTGLGSDDVPNTTYDFKYKNLKWAGRSWDANISNKGLVGSILNIGSGIYRVIDHVNTDTVSHEGEVRAKLISGSNTLTVDQDVYINKDITYGRIIALLKKFIVAYQLTKVIVNIDFAEKASIAAPGKVRVGASDNMGSATVVAIEGSGTFEGDSGVVIGVNKDLLVDFVDTAGSPVNDCSAKGHIVVYGIKKVVKVVEAQNLRTVNETTGQLTQS